MVKLLGLRGLVMKPVLPSQGLADVVGSTRGHDRHCQEADTDDAQREEQSRSAAS